MEEKDNTSFSTKQQMELIFQNNKGNASFQSKAQAGFLTAHHEMLRVLKLSAPQLGTNPLSV